MWLMFLILLCSVDRDSAIVLRTMKEELSIKWEHKRSSKTRNRILEIWENVLEELSKVYIDIDYKAYVARMQYANFI